MKNSIEEAKQLGDFETFLARLKESANYFVAKETGREDAIDLCIAKAWVDSRKEKMYKEKLAIAVKALKQHNCAPFSTPKTCKHCVALAKIKGE